MTVPEVAKVRVPVNWKILTPVLVYGAILIGLVVLICWCLAQPAVPPCEVCVP
jgi:hypothetical protein